MFLSPHYDFGDFVQVLLELHLEVLQRLCPTVEDASVLILAAVAVRVQVGLRGQHRRAGLLQLCKRQVPTLDYLSFDLLCSDLTLNLHLSHTCAAGFDHFLQALLLLLEAVQC